MLENVERDGIVEWEDVRVSKGCPSTERTARGACAVIECLHEIPCNPCQTGCPFGAITVGDPITNLPALDDEKCRGCGVCLTVCPGLAIFMEDCSLGDDKANVTFPFEYIPLPERGAVVRATDRSGREICDAVVAGVKKPRGTNKTATITITVPRELVHEARGIAMP